ncbi:MAG: IS110 family transposase [Chloroflexi bacterium]|nr:IS110 family transposase [Chloroflexota bacterium]
MPPEKPVPSTSSGQAPSAMLRAGPTRFIGLDVHKHYLIAIGVDAELNQVLGPQRVQLRHLEKWMRKTLTPQDAVVLEMTTNAFQLHDDLLPHVHSVTLVHPPHVKLITRAQVMTDKIAALILARLHAVGLLPPVWVPPLEVRDHRALVAHRAKMVRLATQAKNRLHAVLHRYHLLPPGGGLFTPDAREWWLTLDVTPIQHARIQSDFDTLAFAQSQISRLEETLTAVAAQDKRVLLLVQLPGIGLITAMTLLAAIGDISRFPDAKHLVGYSGLGSRVHDSGLTRRTGGMTKAGRRDIRAAMVEAAHAASRTHRHWKAELARLEPRLGHNKAIVAIARKLLVAVWHVLAKGCADRFAEPDLIARKFLSYAETLGKANRPDGQTAAQYVRYHLDRLGLGADLTAIRRGPNKTISLPPSRLILAGN